MANRNRIHQALDRQSTYSCVFGKSDETSKPTQTSRKHVKVNSHLKLWVVQGTLELCSSALPINPTYHINDTP